jgi:chromosome segregation ATPase
MTEFPDPDRSDKELYIEFLQDRIEFLEEELRKSEQEKLDLRERQQIRSSDRVTSNDLRELFGHLINEYSDIREAQRALENQDRGLDEWLDDVKNQVEEVESKNRDLFEVGQKHGVFDENTDYQDWNP